MSELDFEADGQFEGEEPLIPGDRAEAMGRLADLVKAQAAWEDLIDNLERQMEAARRELTRYRADLIPGLMGEVGVSSFRTVDGLTVEVKKVVSASVPSEDGERKARALKWLRDIGAGDIIKNEVRATFGRGEDDLAGKAAEAFRAIGADFSRKISVNPQSLSALIRRRREAGEEVNADDLVLYEAEVSKISRPKTAGSRKN